MIYKFRKDIESDFEGYQELIDFYHQTEKVFFDEVVVDFSNVFWFEANLCAVLGAILVELKSKLNNIKFIRLNDKIKNIFLRNDFLSYSSSEKLVNFGQTTIKYRKFDSKDEKYFMHYVNGELLSKSDLPKMTIQLKKKISESIFEIFVNSVSHSETILGIFTCGQYFPTKERIDFTIVDRGIGIKEKIRKEIGEKMQGDEAIAWALEERNTTRKGDIPGGLGLKLIKEFIKLNEGRIQIVSNDGFCELSGNEVFQQVFNLTFPGTLVNIRFNIADTKRYKMSDEVDENEIF
ncbi:MAG: ATP-binding protein [Elusimicrobia bacterium CG08_land_8_20_14_0_20_44_26]|nr:MAG: ATP-binding protein [Elusimicrobia bacterium CG08_land_8_20_14_0_20_44_26]